MYIRSTMTACGLAIAAIAGGVGSAVAAGDGPAGLSGNGAASAFGNSTTHGHLSAQFGAVQGTLNKLCVGLPAKANVGSLLLIVPITVQDVNVLASPQNQQCADNSSQSSGSE
ncbi:rodlin [Streptomyces sp. NPDC050315]|uniref:rodlin n=1 Tax=Streptomyces sp. NPDC050315 TaxID=3155039 RepID=UPI00343AEC44